jgi:hypothetical protein
MYARGVSGMAQPQDLEQTITSVSGRPGARLDFMLGENENTDTLRDEFGGIAGLTRF